MLYPGDLAKLDGEERPAWLWSAARAWISGNEPIRMLCVGEPLFVLAYIERDNINRLDTFVLTNDGKQGWTYSGKLKPWE